MHTSPSILGLTKPTHHRTLPVHPSQASVEPKETLRRSPLKLGCRPRLDVRTLAFTGVVAILLVGCGGGSSKSVASNTVSTGGAAPRNSTVNTDNSCGRDAVDAVKKHLARPDVVEVSVIGGCSQLSIATSLSPTASAEGKAICDKAAEVGYVGEISSITVLAVNNRELAAGLKTASCIGEP